MTVELILRDHAASAETVLLVSAPPGATLDELASHLRPYHAGGQLFVNGQPVAGAASVGSLGLVDGSVVDIGPGAPHDLPPQGPRLRFEAGPRAGDSLGLTPGVHVMGRKDADIVVPDQEVSSVHCRLVVADGPLGAQITVEDLGSTNGTAVDGVRIAASTALAPGQTLTLGRTRCSVAVDVPPQLETIAAPDGTLQVKFQKRVDVHALPGNLRLTWPAAPNEHEATKFPVVALAVPLVLAVVMAVVMDRMYMLAFAVMSPVLGAANYFSERKRRREREHGAGRQHDDAVAKMEQRLAAAVQRELETHRARWPSSAETVETALLRSGRLWQRRPTDDDVGEIRLGVAARPARSVTIEAGRDAEPPEVPVLRQDPVGISLFDAGNLGIQGPDPATRGLVRSILLQLATYHPPHQMTMSAIFRDGAAADFEWIRWLPHVRSGATARVGNTPESVARELQRLADIVNDRRVANDASRGSARFVTHVAVIEDTGTHDAAVTELILGHGPAVGVHCIVVERGRERVPGPCRAAVNLAAAVEGTGWTGSVELVDGTTVHELDVELISPEVAARAARSMASLRPFAGVADRGAGIPNVVRLIDQLGMRGISAEDVLQRWSVASGATAAIIGESAAGPVAFDLAATPHGVAAGTTGTGKSQLLISMVGSLAAANAPEDLNFVLVDFKGGGAFHRCAELPHTVAMITNLTGGVERTVHSLDIELKRREGLFRPYDASLVAYEQARRLDPAIGPKVPRLVVVIDEFAEFIGDHDDLEEQLESLARKGRSPGVHLILGTQSPSQAIRGKIDAQLELGIALRLKDPGESLHVIKDAAAASLPLEPRGRAYIRTAGPVVEFQVATLGLPVTTETSDVEFGVVHRPWAEVGLAPRFPSGGTPPPPPSALRTDLDEMVDLLIDAASVGGLVPAPSPVLDLLPSAISLNELNSGMSSGGRPGGPTTPAVWLEEHLSEQRHVPGGWQPEHGNLLLVGSPGAGRTSTLRTLAGMLAATRSPDEVHLQVIDFGGSLLSLDDLPHTGTVATRNDRLQMQRLVAWLVAEIERRRELIVVQHRAGSLRELRERMIDAPPMVVLLVDQWEVALQTEWEDLGDELRQVFKEGPPLGIVSVVSSDSRRLNRIAESMSTAIALRIADRSAYSEVLGDFVKARDLPVGIEPGRAFRVMQHPDDRLEVIPMQIGHLGSSPDAAVQNDSIAFIAEHGQPAYLHTPYRVDAMPRSIEVAAAVALGPSAPSDRAVPLGVGGDQLSVRWFDFGAERVLVVAGDAGSGRSNALAVVRNWLAGMGHDVVTVATSAAASGSAVPGRVLSVKDLPERVGTIGSDAFVFVDDLALIEDPAAQEALEAMLRDDGGPAMVVSTGADDLRGLTRGVHKPLAAKRTGLLLNPQRRHDEVFGLRIARVESIVGPPGRAFLVASGTPALVQVPKA
ncbi:MAG: FtsK/SpoIIIE domain-containing protein [Acidimicrobiales bacterium]